jgi:hyperosmotically inducible periplasmic protein
MKARTLSLLALAGLLSAGLSSPLMLYAQSAAGQQMQDSGAAAKSAASDTGAAIKHAYHATADEIRDAALTTKVKTALLEDQATRKYSIHVKSDQGNVTLSGSVDSPAAAQRAEALAAKVKGVESVNNELTISTSAAR